MFFPVKTTISSRFPYGFAISPSTAVKSFEAAARQTAKLQGLRPQRCKAQGQMGDWSSWGPVTIGDFMGFLDEFLG